jgi:hypothetical protein
MPTTTTNEARNDGPQLGANMPTVLFLTWLFVAGTVVGLGAYDTVRAGFSDGWLLLLGGGMILVFALRDWFLRDGGEFAARDVDEWFLLVTAFVFAVSLWALLGRFVFVSRPV